MRILITTPGHLKTVPMGRYCAETLRSLGHDVRLFDAGSLTGPEKLLLRPLAKLAGRHRFEKTRLNARLLAAAREFRPDLFLAMMGFDIFPETVEAVRRGGARTACWWLNDPFQFERGLGIGKAYDRFFTNCERSAGRYREAGLRAAAYLPHAAFTAIHRRVEVPAAERSKWESEVCFVGDWGPVRQGILSLLSQRVNLKIWGPWRKHLTPKDRLWSRVHDGYFTPEDMARALSCAQLTVNLHSWFGYYDCGLNPRTFEAPAHGVAQLCDWKESLPSHFKEGEEIVIYRSGFELEGKIRELLADAAARDRVARAGLHRVLAEHTYEHRMKELLAAVSSL